MDIRHHSGPDEGSTLPAIYEVGPDSFRICLARPDAPRPASFSTSSDSTLMVITYKRKK